MISFKIFINSDDFFKFFILCNSLEPKPNFSLNFCYLKIYNSIFDQFIDIFGTFSRRYLTLIEKNFISFL